MELKDYQVEVIADLKNYLVHLNQTRILDKAFAQHWLNMPSGISYDTVPYKNTIRGVPHVCLKVPTGGGKTFLAVNSLHPIIDSLLELSPYRPAFVVWLVPSRTILQQTYQQLVDPQHPYHRKLSQHFNGRVQVYQKEDLLMASGFNADTVKQGLSIVVMTFASLRAKNKDDRKIYQENGNLYSFALSEDRKIINTDLPDHAPDSLINVIRSLNPVLVVDESHNAESDLSVEMLANLNPAIILDLTATPRENSNVISFTDIGKLKKANMVKLPVMVKNLTQKDEVLENAIGVRNTLEQWAKEEAEAGAPYVRPIALIQAEPKGKEDAQTFELIKKQLIKLEIPESHIAIKTAAVDELKSVDLMSESCPIRYIITVNALKEGWDCPFAYVLATVADKSSVVDVTQILGRVLRKPHQHFFANHQGLNNAYVLTASSKFQTVLTGIVAGLNQAGFSNHDYYVVEEEETEQQPAPTPPKPDPEQLKIQYPVAPTPPTTSTETQPAQGDSSSSTPAWTPNPITNPELSGYYAQGIQTLEQAEEARKKHVDPDVQESDENTKTPNPPKDVNVVPRVSTIKPIFKESAEAILLPQFYWTASQGDYDLVSETLNKDRGGLIFDYNNLLGGADLQHAPIDIDFKTVLSQIQAVDIEALDEERREYQVTSQKLSAERKKREDAVILGQTLPSQQLSAQSRLFQMIGKVYPFSEEQLNGYLKRITSQMDSDQIAELLQNDFDYVKAIKNALEDFKKIYAYKKFKEALDTDKVTTKPSWRFPSQLSPKEDGSSVAKSLYTVAGAMNGFELDVISSIAALENVHWWYRNDEKLKKNVSFCLNGYLNYFPDFIVRLKSGKVVLIETKGGHLDKDEVRKKVELAQLWQFLAGRQHFRHFMVFEHDVGVQDTYSVAKALELIGQL